VGLKVVRHFLGQCSHRDLSSGLYYLPDVRSIIQEEMAVAHTPSVQAMMTKDEASRALGIDLVDQGEGRAVTQMTVRADMVNGHAIAHGGLIFTLADTAFACACNSYGPATVAASADIVFVAPARAGDVLIAEAVVRTRFGRSGLYDVTVRRDGEVIAEFRGRSHQLTPTPAAPTQAPAPAAPAS
jgi:acyl-CoA thioesterase